MGRVYDALKRASSVREGGPSPRKKTDTSARRKGAIAGHGLAGVPPAKAGDAHPWDSSPLFARNAAHDSASTAHTEEHTGSALSGVMTSRAAGATLDAAGTTRVREEFVSLDISATRVEPHLVAVTQPRSAYCEQYRSLRTRIIQAHERRKMQTFVITSSNIAEGKTLTALNLSWLLAQTDGVSALLIDSDLRQPCAGEYLGIDTPVGLSEVLSGAAKLQDAIIRLEPAGLHFLPGGAPREDVAEILSGPRIGKVLTELRSMFDYIIIDAPPLGIFTDANVLINRADGALLVVRSGKTRYGTLDRLLEQLPRERMLGVILNRTDEQLNDTSYYYHRRYAPREGKLAAPAATTTETQETEEVIVAS